MNISEIIRQHSRWIKQLNNSEIAIIVINEILAIIIKDVNKVIVYT